jgi:hypothetical protein
MIIHHHRCSPFDFHITLVYQILPTSTHPITFCILKLSRLFGTKELSDIPMATSEVLLLLLSLGAGPFPLGALHLLYLLRSPSHRRFYLARCLGRIFIQIRRRHIRCIWTGGSIPRIVSLNRCRWGRSFIHCAAFN